MKNLGKITDAKDITTKEYVDNHQWLTDHVSLRNYQRGTSDIAMFSVVDRVRANRLAFLPADQIIVEKTTDGGTTWVSAGMSDLDKRNVFTASGGITIPALANNVRSTLCGVRITITGMKYNVPANTAETDKYNYWNSSYVLSTERYCTLDRFWFWVSSTNDSMSVKIERATGAASTTWYNAFNDTSFSMTGWAGADWVKTSSGVFGGGTNQTGNYWNWRITCFMKPASGDTFSGTGNMAIYHIRGYGENVWTSPNPLMYHDRLYSYDVNKNATFPAKIVAGAAPENNMDVTTKTYVDKIPYGVCDTAAATVAKTVTLDRTVALETGVVIYVKFTYINSVANPTLNVNTLGAKPIIRYGTTAAGTNGNTSWFAGNIVSLVYDGTNWVLVDWASKENTNTVPQVQCETPAATAAKGGACTNFSLLTNSYVMVNMRYSNSSASAITMNINSTGAKPIYINGTASSATNYTLPAGSYLVFYDGTNYYFNTLGQIYANQFVAANDPTSNLQVATKRYVDNSQPQYISLSAASGTLTSDQLSTLQASNENYIMYSNGRYILVYKTSTELYYEWISAALHKIQYFKITISSGAYTYADVNISTTDTKNTAGSTDTSSKIFLVGATSQAANPQTYSDNQVYATNGQLDANSVRIAEAVSLVYDSTNKCLNFNFS